MSRETLLDDAIAKAKEAEDWQLVGWLRMARGEEAAARWYTEKLLEAWRAERKLMNENAKLRDELDLCLKQVKKCEECEAMFNCEDCEAMLDCDECLRADASQKERKRLDYENDSLRELVRTFYYCTTSGECDECPINGGGPVHLMPDTICDTIHDRMRELGVEV